LQTPKRAKRVRYGAQEQVQERDKPNCAKNVGKTVQFVKYHFLTSRKMKYDPSKEKWQGSCWIIMIMSNQLLHD